MAVLGHCTPLYSELLLHLARTSPCLPWLPPSLQPHARVKPMVQESPDVVFHTVRLCLCTRSLRVVSRHAVLD
jgi:hypothetical protein